MPDNTEKVKIKNDEKPKQSPFFVRLRNFLIFAAALIILICCVSDRIGYQNTQEEWHFLSYLRASGIPVDAEVTGKDVEQGCGCERYFITYVYEAGDSQFKKRVWISIDVYNTLAIGSKLPVTYAPDDASQSAPTFEVRAAREPGAFFPWVTCFASVLMAAIALLGWAIISAQNQRATGR